MDNDEEILKANNFEENVEELEEIEDGECKEVK